MQDRSQKTEKPTPRKLEKARGEGQIAASGELISSLHFLGFVALLGAYGASWLAGMREMMYIDLREAFSGRMHGVFLQQFAIRMASRSLMPFLAAGLGLTVLTFLVHLLLTGFSWSGKKLAPDLKRLNPLQRLKNLPSQNSWALLKTMLMSAFFAYAVWYFTSENWRTFQKLPLTTAAAAMDVISGAINGVIWKLGGLMILLGGVDLIRQRKQFNDSMKMSKQDIKDEARESDGNPQIKMRIRRLQRSMRGRQMMKDVATATAVIVNPTHYAVAIRYDVDGMAVPVVIAKGKDFMALRIRQLATEAHVPIVENKLLAQTLYKTVNVGQEIPPAMYRAIAEILAYIQRMVAHR